ncbi:MAG: hypothetical protein Q9167_004304 [Letrouitia subvulpina]
MSFAAPVSRDGFHYNGDLFVEVGGLNRHKRASLPELTAILRPDLKKSKPAAAAQSKDQVGHWYEAQLLHYGLPPSKDKARAKMRLLEALNKGQLAVPSEITRLEESLKKEYAAADRKAKAEYKAQMDASSNPAATGKKRKASQTGKHEDRTPSQLPYGVATPPAGMPFAATTIYHYPNEQGLSDAGQQGQPAKKKSKSSTTKASSNQKGNESQAPNKSKAVKSSTSKVAEAKEAGTKLGNPNGAAKGSKSDTIGKAKSVNPTKQPESAKAAADKPTGPKKQTAKRTLPSTKISGKKETVVKSERLVSSKMRKTEPSAKPAVKKETVVKNENPTSSKITEPIIKREPSSLSTIPPFPSGANTTLGLINGYYRIDCPRIATEWSREYPSTLSIRLDSHSVWAAYNFGPFEGIFFIPQRPYSASEAPLPFKWRGRERETGEMTFGHSCDGEIAFLGNGRISGWFNVYGICSFEGTKIEGQTRELRSAANMRYEWDGYNEEAYETERRQRWG